MPKTEIHRPEKVTIEEAEASRGYDRSFGMFFLDTISDVADLRPRTYKVLVTMLANLGYKNIVAMSRNEIASRTGISKQHVSTELAELQRRKLIKKVNGGYQLSLDHFWRGKAVDYHQEIEKDLKESGFLEAEFVDSSATDSESAGKAAPSSTPCESQSGDEGPGT